MSKIIDTFMFFNELDLLEIRLHILDPYVDYFVLSESTMTFSGKTKPLYYQENKERFKQFEHKIIYNLVDDIPTDFSKFKLDHFTDWTKIYDHKNNAKALLKSPRDCQMEVYQRDSIINALLKKEVDDEDIILCSDLDEIPSPKIFNNLVEILKYNELLHCNQRWYMYYLNNYCEKDWFGTRICKYKYLKTKSVDLVRFSTENRNMQQGAILEDAGWHFSYLGGADKVREKLESIAYKGNKSTWILHFVDKIFKNRIKNKIENNEDIFLTGREFKFVELDDSFPMYVTENKNKYKDMIWDNLLKSSVSKKT